MRYPQVVPSSGTALHCSLQTCVGLVWHNCSSSLTCGPTHSPIGPVSASNPEGCVRCRKWKLISHPDTTNPFVASFVNYRCTCRLYPITVGSQTFFDWKGETCDISPHPSPLLLTKGPPSYMLLLRRGILHRSAPCNRDAGEAVIPACIPAGVIWGLIQDFRENRRCII